MINNDLVTGTPDIIETAVFNAHTDTGPTVQAVVNILTDKRATVRFFLPKYPTDNNFLWMRRKHPETANKITTAINKYIQERKAEIMYYGF